MSTTPSRSLISLALVAVSLGVIGVERPVATAQQGSGCEEPFAPIFTWYQPPSTPDIVQEFPDHQVEVPDLYGQGIGLPDPEPTLDTDGDGVPDRIGPASVDGRFAVAIVRSGGNLILSLPGHDVSIGQGWPVGDLDGDGKDEVLLRASESAGMGIRVFAVPGDTPNGEHHLNDAAVEVPTRSLGSPAAAELAYWQPGGNRVAGPGADLAITSDGTTQFVSGESIMAAGPGGEATLEPDPSMRVDGVLIGVFDLGDPLPALLTKVDSQRGGINGRLLLLTDGPPRQFSLPGFPDRFAIVDHEGRRLLRATIGTRSGSGGSFWDIDEPCRPLPEAVGRPTSPTSPPAAPRPGTAQYTG